MKLAAVDLNLLVAFDALLAEGSVSGAARRIGLSQPAMSKRLGRLRSLFRDDLFVRSGDGVKPTQRALDLADTIRSALGQIQDVLGGYGRFDTSRSARTFRIGAMDHIAAVLLPYAMAMVRIQAPRATVIVPTWRWQPFPMRRPQSSAQHCSRSATCRSFPPGTGRSRKS
jgi:LysR family transcriptional activator of mexEF-oprN operon